MVTVFKRILRIAGLATLIMSITLEIKAADSTPKKHHVDTPGGHCVNVSDFTITTDEIIEAISNGILEEVIKEKAQMRILIIDWSVSYSRWLLYEGEVEISELNEIEMLQNIEDTQIATIGFYPVENEEFIKNQMITVLATVIGVEKSTDPTDPVEPGPVEPEPVEPGPVESGPVESGPVEPGPVEPEPVEPGPVESGLVEPVIKMQQPEVEEVRLQSNDIPENTKEESLLKDTTVVTDKCLENKVKKMKPEKVKLQYVKTITILWYQAVLLLCGVASGLFGFSIAGDIRVLRWYKKKRG